MKKLHSYQFLLAACTFLLVTNLKAQTYLGCTDPAATNYSANALMNDGSCCYSNWVTLSSDFQLTIHVQSLTGLINATYTFPGSYSFCIDNGCNALYAVSLDGLPFEFTATTNNNVQNFTGSGDGMHFSLSFGDLTSGCTDPGACNFNPQANCDDNTCDYGCYGCTDVSAINYNPSATIDDGTCCSDPSFYYTIASSTPIVVYWNSFSTGLNGAFNYPSVNGFCGGTSCFTLEAYSISGEAFDFQLFSPSGEVIYSTSSVGPQNSIYTTYSPGGGSGCADSYACNFDPDACYSYSTCTYDCLGCTDPAAPNFDPNASVDDGSCCTLETYTIVTSSVPCGLVLMNESQTFNDLLILDSSTVASTCIVDGCYSFYAYPFDSGSGAEISIIRGNTVLFSGYVNFNQYYYQFTSNGIVGCVDPNACNFEPTATCSDYNACTYDCYGCMDPTAINYNASATIDNGLCCYNGLILTSDIPIYFSAYSNYSYENYFCSTVPGQDNTLCIADGCYGFYAYSQDGSPASFTLSTADGQIILEGNTSDPLLFNGVFSYNAIAGCSDMNACNYDPSANCLDYNMCDYSCYGCTNPNAPNYDEGATIDDGSCCTASWYSFTASGPCQWNVFSNSYYNYYYGGGNYPQENGFCMNDTTCFSLLVYSLTTDTINFTITNQFGELLYSGSTQSYGYGQADISQGQIYGCTDPYACNYDPTAQCQEWNTCDYGCFGCTNPSAPNYNPSATIDDGTCCTDTWYTFNCSDAAYFSYYNASGYGGDGINGEGFCTNTSCFLFYVYVLSTQNASFTISDINGNVVFSGTTSGGWFQGSIGTAQEIPGCTDQGACNYSPDATCNDGSCVYYCGGCTDPTAINYSPYAIFDDGSCFFNPEIPEMQLYVQEDELNNQYYLRMQVNSLGNGSPYMMTTDQSNQMMMINNTGSYVTGPFSCDQSVVLSMSSAVYGNTNYLTSNPISAPCSVTGVEKLKETTQWNLYPNPTAGIINLAGLEPGAAQITITDMTGRVVMRVTRNAQAIQEIDASSLPAGIYQLTVSRDQSSTSKVVVISK